MGPRRKAISMRSPPWSVAAIGCARPQRDARRRGTVNNLFFPAIFWESRGSSEVKRVRHLAGQKGSNMNPQPIAAGMKRPAHFLGALVLWLACTAGAWAFPVVEWNTVHMDYEFAQPPAQAFTLFTQWDPWTGAGVSGGADQNLSGLWVTLMAYSTTLGIAHRWFEVDYGELINGDTALASDAFADNMTPEHGSLHLDYGQVLYLGFRLGGTDFLPDTQYGWAELYFDGDTVSVTASATERTGLGIYAGTGTAIPEPATAGLLLIGAAGLAWRKRKAFIARNPAGPPHATPQHVGGRKD